MEQSYLDLHPLDMSSGTTIARSKSGRELLTDSSMTRQFSAISKLSLRKGTPAHIREWLISLQLDSPASHSLQEVSGLDKMTNATGGQKRLSAFALFDPGERCWKTPQKSLLTHTLEKFSLGWPRSGTLANGMCFRRACLVHHKHVTGCSYWPTPTASMGKSGWGLSRTKERYRKGTTERCLKTGWAPSPEMLEAVQGWPIGWSGLKPLATDRYRWWLETHGSI